MHNSSPMMRDAHVSREINQRLNEGRARANREMIRGNLIRAAAYRFAKHGSVERHRKLAALDNALEHSSLHDPLIVAQIVLDLERISPDSYREAFGVPDPTDDDATAFVADVSADHWARANGVPVEPLCRIGAGLPPVGRVTLVKRRRYRSRLGKSKMAAKVAICSAKFQVPRGRSSLFPQKHRRFR